MKYVLKASNSQLNPLALICLAIVTIATSLIFSNSAKAYDRNYLIDDNLYTDTKSLSLNQIQAELAKGGGLLANWKDDVDMYATDSRFKTSGNRCLVHKATGMTAAQVIHQAATDWQATYVVWKDSSGNEVSKDPRRYSGNVHECHVVRKYADTNLPTISPKAIIVTLEKEQSLISAGGTYSKTQSSYYDPGCCSNNSYKLAWAMGYGVPDTNIKLHGYKGFYNQVMYGTWQLRFNYEKSAGSTSWDGTGGWGYSGYRVGQTANIDGTNVTFKNRSTASLYYYTPHLHGNQLFVNIYENKFGPTVKPGETAITNRYNALDSETKTKLGSPTRGVVCGIKDGGCYRNFKNGAILWSPKTGAWENWGPIRERYKALRFETSVLGYPTGKIVCEIKDGGCYQNFQNGSLLWQQNTGAWESLGAIRNRYKQLNYENGALGYPTSGEVCGIKEGGCYQNFQGGAILWSPKTGAWENSGPVRERYGQLGFESSSLGYPTDSGVCGIKDNGCYQNFERGAILWSPKTGAWENSEPVRERYRQLGFEQSGLGYPTKGMICGIRNGGCYQNFERGAILWHKDAGAWESLGGIRSRYKLLGFEKSQLGYPTTGEVCGLKEGGCYQNFQGGAILWSPKTGAWENWGSIRKRYKHMQYENGLLGYPTTGEVCGLKEGGCYQNFQGGAILWSPKTGAWENWGPIRDKYSSLRFEKGRLGYPISNLACGTNGSCSQKYQGGTIRKSGTDTITVEYN